MTDPMPPPRQPDRDSGLLATLALAVVVGLLLFFALRFMHGLQARAVDEREWQSVSNELRIFAGVAATALIGASLILGAMLRRIGSATLATRHFPPPGAGLSVKQPLDGNAALERGTQFRQLGTALMVLGPILSVLGVWIVFRM